MSQTNDISSYRQFWHYYLREHAKPLTRKLHFFGTGLATTALGASAYLANGWLLMAALVLGYGPAWIAHFFVEQNRPATFRFPFWSLFSDLRMTGLWLTGRLSKELEMAGLPGSGPSLELTKR